MTAASVTWLGVLPPSWNLVPAKAAFEERRQANRRDDVHLTPSQIHGVLPQSEYMARTGNAVVQNLQGQDSMKHVEPNDFIIHLRSFQGGIERSTYSGKVSTAYTVLASKSGVVPNYFRWLLKSDAYIQELRTTTNQLRDGQSIKFGDFVKVALPLPPIGEQRAIADYLDRETARIDRILREQQLLMEMLRERRDSVWAVRLEEAGRVGPHVSIRRLIESIVDGPFGSALTSAHYSDDGARVIRLGNIGVDEFRDREAAFIPLNYAKDLEAHAVEEGDVVVAGLGDDKMPLGRAAVVPALGPAVVKADCYRLRPNGMVGSAYLAWALSAPQTRSQIMLLARGSTRARLNTKVVQGVEIPVPNPSRQHELVDQSHTETAKIDQLMEETEHFVELARERRTALITAAVTGQIDIRAAA